MEARPVAPDQRPEATLEWGVRIPMKTTSAIVLALVAAGATALYNQSAASSLTVEKGMPGTSNASEVTCLLTPDELQKQRKDSLAGLFQRAEKITDLQNGLRFNFAHGPGLLAELTGILEREQVCSTGYRSDCA